MKRAGRALGFLVAALSALGAFPACNALFGLEESKGLLQTDECETVGDCPDGEECHDGQCEAMDQGADGGGPECSRNLNCAPSEVCLDGRCELEDEDEYGDDAPPDASIETDDDTPEDDDTGPCREGNTRECSGPDLRGSCAQGEQECDGNGEWGECSIQPGTDTCEPGNDDSCNGAVNEGCPCDDGTGRPCVQGGYFGACAEGMQLCEDGAWSECDIEPAAADACTPGDDSNCNDEPNEGCDCEEGETQSCAESIALGTCADGVQECDVDGAWGPCDVDATAMDGCEPGNDDNCNGIANEDCPCEDGETRPCSDGGFSGPCEMGEQTCLDDVWGECSIPPAESDSCEPDNDDNCNGIANEGCGCTEGDTRACSEGGLFGKCADGTQTCSDGEWGPCSIQPSGADTCNPGNDDDCDGNQNEGCPCTQGDTRGCDEGGFFGLCATGSQTCLSNGSWGGCSETPGAYDTCATGNDGNCDGVPNSPLDPICQCVEGQLRCVTGSPSTGRQQCTSVGQWQDIADCQYVCAGAGQCTGACVPGARDCSGATPMECDQVGQWVNETACETGTTCEGAGECMISGCGSGTYLSGATCEPWTNCGPGQYVQTQGTATSDRLCAVCAAGTFSGSSNAQTCGAWSECSAGQYAEVAGTASSDRLCTPCGAGTYSAAGATSCSSWTTCGAGEYEQAAGSAAANRMCQSCAAGTYSATTNAASCSSCATGTYSDAGATSCTACGGQSWSGSGAATCLGWTTCSSGQYVQSGGSATADRVCQDCAAGTYSTTTNEPSCTACAAGTYSAGVGAASCAVCGTGTYSAGTGATGCMSCTTCTQGEIDACTATSDRTCVVCTAATATSCSGLSADCGASSNESCCTSCAVPGGTFNRINNSSYPATVSDFRLDKFEVTVGRFRKFKAAWDGGWRPAADSGKHPHLNSANGLANSEGSTTYELGWNAGLESSVAPTDANLACHATYPIWTPSAGGNERRPVNCVNWVEAYAFCIWDGAFLPSEAEWNYAAAGGTEQRPYPWGSTAPTTDANLAIYGCYYNGSGSCSGVTNIALVGSVVAGNGRYGQSDLAGNMIEWNVDRYASTSTAFVAECNDCAYLPLGSTNREVRGGGFGTSVSYLLTTYRASPFTTTSRDQSIGLRCARTP